MSREDVDPERQTNEYRIQRLDKQKNADTTSGQVKLDEQER